MLITLKCNDSFISEKSLKEVASLFKKNKNSILNIVKNVLGEDFKDKEITINLVSQVGSIVYGFTKETNKKVEVRIEVPEGEPKHVLNILGWELTFVLAREKAYKIFFDKFKDYTLAEILADQIGVLVEKEIIQKVGLRGYNPSTILDHSSPRNPALYKLQKKLIEEWPNLKKYNSLSKWLDSILKGFPSEVDANEITAAYLMKNNDMVIRTLHSILKEIKAIRLKDNAKKREWKLKI